MRRSAVAIGFLAGSIATAAVLLTFRGQQPPPVVPAKAASSTAADSDRVRLAVVRLRARLRHPDSLVVVRTMTLPGGTVEIDFTAQGERGRGAAQFWVRFAGGATEDVLPERVEGEVDDPFGVFAP